ncbi:MAG: GGDEF domain-containing response regulator [Mycobacteriales bacterium]
MERVLVVDDDPDVAGFIALNLQLEGFDVAVAYDGVEALASVAQAVPAIILLDVQLPDPDGLAVCRRLREEPATATVPVILLTARTASADKIAGLTAGADDYIIKPFDTVELLARVHSTLRRSAEMRSTSPLTGLPGNTRIHAEIARRVTSGADFAVCYCDLDGFKAFNDAYGFLRGDEVICLLAQALHEAATAAGEPAPFVGHVGGDDFVLVCAPEQVESTCEQVIRLVDARAPALHDAADVARGFISVPARQGQARQAPLVSLSIGIATSMQRRFQDSREVVAVATEMKGVAKSHPGSAYALDRRCVG